MYCGVMVSVFAGLLIIRGKKSEILWDLKRQIHGEDGRFRGNFHGKLSPKSKQESKNERYLKKYRKDVKFWSKKKHKRSSNTVLKATVLVSSDKKNIKIFTKTLGLLFQLQFRAENSNAMNFFPPIALMCCFAVYKARLFVMEGSNPFVNKVKTFLCLQSCPAQMIKHVPAVSTKSLLFWYVVYSWQ